MISSINHSELAACLREVRGRHLHSGFIVASRDGSSHHWYSQNSDPELGSDEIMLTVPDLGTSVEEIDGDLVWDQVHRQAVAQEEQARLDADYDAEEHRLSGAKED